MPVCDRDHLLTKLRNNPNPDVLVVGGGINGISTYRDLALQGVNVVLVERNDFCSGASTALSRMIHGGLRYMENGEFKLVQESLLERNRLLKNAPHYVSPLPTVIPIFNYMSGIWGATRRFFKLSVKPSRRGAVIIKFGLSLYDLFTRKNQVMPSHKFHNKTETFQKWPNFHTDIKCSATYFDAWITYPERLGLELIQDVEAVNDQATALNYLDVYGSNGKTALIKDKQTNEVFSVTPKMIVNATGAWIDFTNGALSTSVDNKKTDLVGGTKGSHLVIRNDALLKATGNQMVYYENQEGRVCIMFPYFGNVLVGSTDLKQDDPDNNRCEQTERDYILESLSFVFPELKIAPEQILYAFSGVRPLTQSNSAITGNISRDHYCELISDKEGFVTPVLCLIGGKWTTFRAFGEQAANKVMKELGISRKVSTHDMAIGGGRNFPVSETALAEKFNLDISVIQRLIKRYGSSAEKVAQFMTSAEDRALKNHNGYSKREMEYILKTEQVMTLSDILCRRTAMAISGELSLGLIEEILDILATQKSWSVDKKQQELADTLARLSYFHGLSEETLRQRKVA